MDGSHGAATKTSHGVQGWDARKRFVLQPAAVNIQRVFRGYMVRKYLEDMRDHIEAAIALQQMWRKRSKVKTTQDKLRGFRVAIRNAKASQIQRSYRCYRARQQLLYLRISYQARYGKAAVAIQSAWRGHCSRVQLKEFRFCSLIERKARSLTQCKESREMIEFDMFDARADLKRIIKYKAKSLKEMRLEWERRQPVVEKELSELTEEDLDRGWGEAFQTEKHILHYSLELSVEDILSRKQQVREYDAEVEDLCLELEDLERDLEECILDETVELEIVSSNAR
ncbi:Abnormal spindle microcephaly-associated protein, partial [Globisporangium splendens]